MHKSGYHCHIFTAKDGGAGPCFCIWETEKAATAGDFKAFLDGPESPLKGAFVNDVQKWNGSGSAPSANWA